MSTLAPEFRPFWHSVRQGVLSFPYCPACHRFHWYPLQHCPYCQNKQLQWRATQGRGTVFSWTVVRHAFSEQFADQLPYVVALLEFADAPGVRLISTIAAQDTKLIAIGAQVLPVFPVAPSQLLTFRILVKERT